MIDTDDKLPNDVTLQNAVILITCIIKNDDKCYPQLFLEEALYYEKGKTFKTYKQKHYVCSATSNRMMELVLAKSEKKE